MDTHAAVIALRKAGYRVTTFGTRSQRRHRVVRKQQRKPWRPGTVINVKANELRAMAATLGGSTA